MRGSFHAAVANFGRHPRWSAGGQNPGRKGLAAGLTLSHGCEKLRPHAWSMCAASRPCVLQSRATPLGRSRYQTSEFPTALEIPTELPTHNALEGGVILGRCILCSGLSIRNFFICLLLLFESGDPRASSLPTNGCQFLRFGLL